MNDAQVTATIRNSQLAYIILSKQVQRFYRQCIGTNGFRIYGHDLAGSNAGEVSILFQHAAQVAVGDDAE